MPHEPASPNQPFSREAVFRFVFNDVSPFSWVVHVKAYQAVKRVWGKYGRGFMSDQPIRIQLRRTKGWRIPANTLKVDRTTRWGNDFIMAHEGTRLLAVAQHREQAIAQNEACPQYYEPLRGKNLACWCPLDQPCHADVLLELANKATAHD